MDFSYSAERYVNTNLIALLGSMDFTFQMVCLNNYVFLLTWNIDREDIGFQLSYDPLSDIALLHRQIFNEAGFLIKNSKSP
ncbi:hypothetical protein D3C78_1191760 [compost metagenome]